MRLFSFSLKDGKLIHDPKGNIVAFVDGELVKIMYKNGEEIDTNKVSFLLSNDDAKLIEKINKIEKINILPALVYPEEERRLRLLQILGTSFEDFIYERLKGKYNIVKHPNIFKSLSKLTNSRNFNIPDFLVNNKVIIEAKVGEYNYHQIETYSRYFKYGIVAIPFSGNCRVPKFWQCVNNCVLDIERLTKRIDFYLNK
ncbi:hypothetical protein [Acidianus brierleyi]|uniref:Uncharacterized protein n=1 Tax=Acidianus brierleyi TaxID=41673 RepID=A0A2U9IC04_9CREN|nr:hypothetical protein [Acidianus brierleyi]AWR93551.1 hypothetical protein DFR85_01915 [Acidianus brierleyi]